jgi:hypothetical protein
LAHKPQSAIAVLAAAYEDGEPFAAVALADALLSTGHTREARDALTAAADCHDDALACVALAQLVEETQERSGWLERAELLGGLGEETLPKWTKKRALVWITLDDLRPPPTTPKGHDTL